MGELDPLLQDSLQLADKLAAAKIPHDIKRYPGVPHAFVMLNRLYDGARDANNDAAAWLKYHLQL